MEDFKKFFVLVAFEGCGGLNLSATHFVFPVVALATFSVHIFFCFSLNVVVSDSDSTNYFSQVLCLFVRYYWVTLKMF